MDVFHKVRLGLCLKAVISGLLFLNSRCLPKATESERGVPTDWATTRSAVRWVLGESQLRYLSVRSVRKAECL